MQWLLSTALVSSTTILKTTELFTTQEDGTALSYRRFGIIALAFALAMNQLNTLYTFGGVSLPPLKCIEGIALLTGTVLFLLDRNQEQVVRKEQLPRVILTAFTIFRLISEMRGNTLLGGYQALVAPGRLWHTLVSFEIGACLLLLDRRFSGNRNS